MSPEHPTTPSARTAPPREPAPVGRPERAVRPRAGAGRRSAGAIVAIFAAGLLLGVLMLARAQAGGDQLNLLARGWLLAARGDLVPYGNPLSNQGNGPGPLTSLVVGLPL